MLVYRRRPIALILASLLLTVVACERNRDEPGEVRQQYLTKRPLDEQGRVPLRDRDRPIELAVTEWLAAGLNEDQIRDKIAEGLKHNVLIAPMQPNIDQEKKLLTAGASVELIEYMKTAHPPEDAYHPRERVKTEQVVVDWLGRDMTEEEIRTKIERGMQENERFPSMSEGEEVLQALREAGASEELIQFLLTLDSRGTLPAAPEAVESSAPGDKAIETG